MTPTEGFDPDIPVVRGRRNPDIEIALEAENALEDAGGDAEVDVFGLLAGDVIIAKITVSGKTPAGDAWYTYGIQTRVADTESEEDAFIRANEIVNSRVLQMADENIARIEGAAAAAQEATTNNRPRIPSRATSNR